MPANSSKKTRKATRSRGIAKTTLRACQDCGAKCCHDLVMPTDKPKTPDDVAEMKWLLMYHPVHVFIRSHRWYLLIKGRCMYLDRNNRCRIYHRRPRRCRDMKPPQCENSGEFCDVMFTDPEQLDAYLAARNRR